MMEIRPIHTDKDHRAALAEIDTCWGAPEGTEEGDRLDVLLALVEIFMKRSVGRSISTRALIRSTCSTMPSRNSGTPRRNWPSFWTRGRAHRKFSQGGARLRST